MTIETRTVEPIAEPKVKTTADVLRHAALIIEERGWCQNSLRERDGRVCLWGGIRTALFADDDGHAFDQDREPLRIVAHLLGLPTGLPTAEHSGLGEVVGWNDELGRTAAEVTTALRAAADAAESAS